MAAVDSNKNTEVILWHNRGGKAGELLEQTMIPKFNETVGKEMGITVTPVYQSSSDLISKVKAPIRQRMWTTCLIWFRYSRATPSI